MHKWNIIAVTVMCMGLFLGVEELYYYEKNQLSTKVVINRATSDFTHFPIETGTATYEDSFGSERTYGGKRSHQGTDIFVAGSQRGSVPVVSVSDGIVEKKGWLKLGGWRLGIRAPKGVNRFLEAIIERYIWTLGDFWLPRGLNILKVPDTAV